MADLLKALKQNETLQHIRDASEKEMQAQDAVLIQGQIMKRGSKESSAFLSRWVVVRPMCITYSKFENTKVIDRIEMEEVIGIANRGSDDHLAEGGAARSSPRSDGAGSVQKRDVQSAFGQSFVSPISAAAASSARNIVFWRFKSEFREEKRAAFSYSLGPTELALFTSPIGFHRGRSFLFRVEDLDAREKWTETISRLLDARRGKPVLKTTTFYNIRKRVRSTYVGDYTQMCVAALIGGNFMLNMCEAQVGKENVQAYEVFEGIDLGFTIIFTIELLVNIFATFLWEFVGDPWNWFDLIVVIVSLISLELEDLPGADSLRLLRCFRVFRLFKRIASLRKIMGSITKSLLPMANAFSIVCLVTAIYAIIAVSFFAEVAPHNFSSFFVAFFSLFQSMTGDNWSTDCRDLMAETGQGAMVGIFYVSFMLLVSLVLINVVIAVLLDAFSKAREDEPAPLLSDPTEYDEELSYPCPFERIAKDLCVAGDLAALEGKIVRIWEAIVTKGQVDKFATSDHEMSYQEFCLVKSALRVWRYGQPSSWIVTRVEFQRGLKALTDYMPPLVISQSQYAKHVTPFCNHRGFLGGTGFRGLIKTALIKYTLRELYRAQKAETHPMDKEGWQPKSVRALMIGTTGLLRADMETHRAGAIANRMKGRFSRKCETEKTPDPLNQMVCGAAFLRV